MQLIYRGMTYSYNSANTTDRSLVQRSARELIYRGSTYQIAPNAMTKSSVESAAYALIYRGNAY